MTDKIVNLLKEINKKESIEFYGFIRHYPSLGFFEHEINVVAWGIIVEDKWNVK